MRMLFIGAALALWAFAAQARSHKVTRMDPRTRGIRNNNPMNLRYVPSIEWDGQIGGDGDGYAVFETPFYGIRAGVKNLVNGYFGRGIDTPRTIIERYAPSHENPTDNYVQFIAQRMNVAPNETIAPSRDNLVRLASAIIYFENGANPYRPDIIKQATKAALI